jgi:hypothetical protein
MPDHQFLQALPNEKFDEICAKDNRKRIVTELKFVIALKTQYGPTSPIPSSNDTQPFAVVMLQADGKRLAGSSHHVQSFIDFP